MLSLCYQLLRIYLTILPHLVKNSLRVLRVSTHLHQNALNRFPHLLLLIMDVQKKLHVRLRAQSPNDIHGLVEHHFESEVQDHSFLDSAVKVVIFSYVLEMVLNKLDQVLVISELLLEDRDINDEIYDLKEGDPDFDRHQLVHEDTVL